MYCNSTVQVQLYCTGNRIKQFTRAVRISIGYAVVAESVRDAVAAVAFFAFAAVVVVAGAAAGVFSVMFVVGVSLAFIMVAVASIVAAAFAVHAARL